MTDAVTASIIGGCFALIVKLVDLGLDYSKHKDQKSSSFEEQRTRFMESLMERLEKVNQERDDAEAEATQYKEKFWYEYEERLKRLEQGKPTRR
jgi:pyruvate/2-oxoacid:ferredoxin oxidoreductase beta subunit